MTINCQKIIRGLNNGNRTLLCLKKKGFKTILSTFIKKNINNWNFKGTRCRGCTHDAELFQTLVEGSFCLDKIHFGETIILAGLVSLVCRSLFVPHLWKLCDFVTFAILELHFWNWDEMLLDDVVLLYKNPSTIFS